MAIGIETRQVSMKLTHKLANTKGDMHEVANHNLDLGERVKCDMPRIRDIHNQFEI